MQRQVHCVSSMKVKPFVECKSLWFFQEMCLTLDVHCSQNEEKSVLFSAGVWSPLHGFSGCRSSCVVAGQQSHPHTLVVRRSDRAVASAESRNRNQRSHILSYSRHDHAVEGVFTKCNQVASRPTASNRSFYTTLTIPKQ